MKKYGAQQNEGIEIANRFVLGDAQVDLPNVKIWNLELHSNFLFEISTVFTGVQFGGIKIKST